MWGSVESGKRCCICERKFERTDTRVQEGNGHLVSGPACERLAHELCWYRKRHMGLMGQLSAAERERNEFRFRLQEANGRIADMEKEREEGPKEKLARLGRELEDAVHARTRAQEDVNRLENALIWARKGVEDDDRVRRLMVWLGAATRELGDGMTRVIQERKGYPIRPGGTTFSLRLSTGEELTLRVDLPDGPRGG